MKELILGNLPLFIKSLAIAAVAGAAVMFLTRLLLNKNEKWQVLWCRAFACAPFIIAALAFILFSANVPYDDDFNSIVAYLAHPWPERIQHIADYNWEHRVGLTNLCAEIMVFITGKVNFQWLAVVGLSFAVGTCFLFWSRFKRYGIAGQFAAASMLWLLMAVISDYFFWSMASIQNNGVIFLALLAFSLLKPGETLSSARFIIAILLGLACTFTSGSGMVVWPVMAGMMIMRRDCRRPIRMWVLFLLVATASILIYFHTPWMAQESTGSNFSLLRALGYFFTFAGAWTCTPWIAIVAGITTCAMLAFFTLRVNETRHPEILFFAGYIIAVMVAGAVFRSVNIHYALPPRHPEMSFSLLGCLLVLTFEQIRLPNGIRHWGVVALCGFAVIVNVFSFNLFGQIWRDRVEIDRRNLLIRPITLEALTCIHSPWQKNAIENLHALESKGIYNSLWTLKKGEKPPARPIPMGDFWTPGRHAHK